MKIALFLCLVLLPMCALAQFPSSAFGPGSAGGTSNINSHQQDSMGTELTDGSNDDDDDDDDDIETSSLPTNYGSSSNDYGLGGPQLLSGGGKAGVAVVALVCVGAVVGGVAFYLIRRG